MRSSKNKNGLRKTIGKLHLWLGLASGLVVFVVAFTGCLWVFQEEITNLTSDKPEIEASGEMPIPPLKAKQIAKQVFPERHVHGTLYSGSKEAVEVIFFEADPEFYQSVFLHPNTGEILEVENHTAGFFHFILEGHMHLWLPEAIGSNIVAWSTVIFVIMLISGIILWWPKNKKARKQRTWFRWKESTRWKRKNYDLHSIAGFYVSILALVAAFTGLVMTFDWVEKTTYSLVGGEREVKFTIPKNTSGAALPVDSANMDKLLPRLISKYPDAVSLEFHYPYTDSSSIYVEITNKEGVYYSSDYRFYDQSTLKEVSTTSIYGDYENAGFSEKVIRMNYDIHVGAIGGLAGKMIAFFTSLICASLPVSGFLIWYGRKFKKAKSKPSSAQFRALGKSA